MEKKSVSKELIERKEDFPPGFEEKLSKRRTTSKTMGTWNLGTGVAKLMIEAYKDLKGGPVCINECRIHHYHAGTLIFALSCIWRLFAEDRDQVSKDASEFFMGFGSELIRDDRYDFIRDLFSFLSLLTD